MIGYLVDTNIPSELTRPRPEPEVAAFIKNAGREHTYLSVLSLGEITKGIVQLPLSRRRTELQEWVDEVMRPWFADRILTVTAPIAERWGNLAGNAWRAGRPLAVVDGCLLQLRSNTN